MLVVIHEIFPMVYQKIDRLFPDWEAAINFIRDNFNSKFEEFYILEQSKSTVVKTINGKRGLLHYQPVSSKIPPFIPKKFKKRFRRRLQRYGERRKWLGVSMIYSGYKNSNKKTFPILELNNLKGIRKSKYLTFKLKGYDNIYYLLQADRPLPIGERSSISLPYIMRTIILNRDTGELNFTYFWLGEDDKPIPISFRKFFMAFQEGYEKADNKELYHRMLYPKTGLDYNKVNSLLTKRFIS